VPPDLMGLLDVTQLDKFEHPKSKFEHAASKFEHQKGKFEPSLSPQRASGEHALCAKKNDAKRAVKKSNGKSTPKRCAKG